MNKKVVLISAIGVIVGCIAGYAYYYYVGCASGTCTITSKPLNSTLYGGLMGGLLFNIFVTNPKKQMNNFWNERYAEADFAYGHEPNVFLKENISKITKGKILFPAEGEAKNAVLAAQSG